MKKDDAKVRLLLVERMLRQNEYISVKKILARLEQYGIYADRKTIYDDVRAINMVMPVESRSGRYGGYIIVDVYGRCDEENCNCPVIPDSSKNKEENKNGKRKVLSGQQAGAGMACSALSAQC